MTEEQLVREYMKDWKGIMDEKGKLIPFDIDMAIDMLKKNPLLFDSLLKVMDLKRCA